MKLRALRQWGLLTVAVGLVGYAHLPSTARIHPSVDRTSYQIVHDAAQHGEAAALNRVPEPSPTMPAEPAGIAPPAPANGKPAASTVPRPAGTGMTPAAGASKDSRGTQTILRIMLAIIGVLLLTSFIPMTAISFFKIRLPRKAKEYGRLLKVLGYKGEHGPAYVPSVAKEYLWSDYLMPTIFATSVTLLGAITLTFGPQLRGLTWDVSLILQGPGLVALEEVRGKGLETQMEGMLVIAMAFVGAYMWSVQSLFRRLATIDLPPSAFYSVGVRMVFSIFAALMLYYSFIPLSSYKYMTNMLVVLAFCAGMFPQRALQLLQERVRFAPKDPNAKADDLPLVMIEGIQIFERVRLAEVGIEKVKPPRECKHDQA